MHFKQWALIPAAFFAVARAVIRAAKPSVTLDEAYTYLHFVVTPLNTVWSFAFVDGAAFLAVLIWAMRLREGGSALRIVVCCALPGLFVALLLCAYPAAHFTDLSWGAHSLKEMRQSLLQSSLYHLDPRFREYSWFKFMSFLRSRLPPALAILCLCQLAATMLDGSWIQDPHSRYRGRFAAALAGIATLAVLLHWLAFRV